MPPLKPSIKIKYARVLGLSDLEKGKEISKANEKIMRQAMGKFMLLGPNNQNKGLPQRMQNLKPVFSRQSPGLHS